MKYLIAVLFLAVVACAPAPTATPIPTSTPEPESTLAATSTPEPTSTNTPTLTPTLAPPYAFPARAATRIAPSALPSLLSPSGAIKFTYDDGVSSQQRVAIQNGIALGQLVWGEVGAIRVFSYADLDGLVEQERLHYGWSQASLQVTKARQRFEDSRVCETSEGVVFCYISPNYLGPRPQVHLALIHEYFHRVQGGLAKNHDDHVPLWLIEGSAEYAETVVSARYNLGDLDGLRKYNMLISRGISRPLSALDTLANADDEDGYSVYSLGFMAAELLATNAGETAVLKTYWEQLGEGLSPSDAFEKAFGVTLTDFYDRFEAYRRAEFPPYCNYWARGSFGLEYVRALPPGSIPNISPGLTPFTSPGLIPYVFCLTGYPLNDQSATRKIQAFRLPHPSALRTSCGANCIIILMGRDLPKGNYTLGFELPDGRKARADFQHS